MNFKFQISNFRFIFIALMGVVLASCSFLGDNNTPSFQLSDLQALWQRNSTQEYVRFTTEQSDETNYLYGYEWDEAEDVQEADRLAEKYGNGWFKYWFETKNGGLHELHFMGNDGAVIPKEYIVSKLTSTDLQYYEKENKNAKFSFSKVVETK